MELMTKKQEEQLVKNHELQEANPDKDMKNKLAHEVATMAESHAQELAKGQIQANVEQAKHPSLFVSGARPAIMWVCCLGLLWQFFVGPILTWATGIWFPDMVPPQLEVEGLITLVMSLLGLGAMRSFEKSKNCHVNF